LEKAILLGPFIGEFYWEFARFGPLLPYLKEKEFKNKDITYIVFTRQERYDIYGNYTDIFVPLKIDGDYDKYQPDCYRLIGLPNSDYENLAYKLNSKYSKRFKIIKHIYPTLKRRFFAQKNQYPIDKMLFKYSPRQNNSLVVENYLPKNNKPLVVLAPRFRKGFRRNWNHWGEFYDKLYNNQNLMNNFNFIICGKKEEYIPDVKHRFLDMNDVELIEGVSTVGILIEIMKRSFFTCGSQSAIPNISLLFGIEALEWGHQRKQHVVWYNIRNTPVTYIDDPHYNIDSKIIFKKFEQILNKKLRKRRV